MLQNGPPFSAFKLFFIQTIEFTMSVSYSVHVEEDHEKWEEKSTEEGTIQKRYQKEIMMKSTRWGTKKNVPQGRLSLAENLTEY